jgi:hypothetical protein
MHSQTVLARSLSIFFLFKAEELRNKCIRYKPFRSSVHFNSKHFSFQKIFRELR